MDCLKLLQDLGIVVEEIQKEGKQNHVEGPHYHQLDGSGCLETRIREASLSWLREASIGQHGIYYAIHRCQGKLPGPRPSEGIYAFKRQRDISCTVGLCLYMSPRIVWNFDTSVNF